MRPLPGLERRRKPQVNTAANGKLTIYLTRTAALAKMCITILSRTRAGENEILPED